MPKRRKEKTVRVCLTCKLARQLIEDIEVPPRIKAMLAGWMIDRRCKNSWWSLELHKTKKAA